MPKRLAVVAFAVAALLAACSKSKPKLNLPIYPSASPRAAGPAEQVAGGTLFYASHQTADSMPMVRPWYDEQFGTQRQWSYTATGLGHAWNNGNMTWLSGGGPAGRVEVPDPTQEGGFVQIVDMQNTTQIETWQFLPAPAPPK